MSQVRVQTILVRLIALGPLLLFCLASLHGAIDRNTSNDIWVTLATGQYIFTHGEVPTTDPFSYTYEGQPWFNPNWLSHAALYGVYHWFGPNWLVILTWLVSASIFSLVAWATYIRCRSWPLALAGASILAMASHAHLTPRPATLAYLCFAVMAVIFARLIDQDRSKSVLPALLLLPLLFFWSHAHGSFIFAFGLTGLFAVCAGWELIRKSNPLLCTLPQLLVTVGAAAAALLLALLWGPYGVDNFIMPFMMLSDRETLSVGEWVPPFLPVRGLPVLWFWLAIAAAIGCVVYLRKLNQLDGDLAAAEPDVSQHLPIHLFDVLSALSGLLLALSSRRFIPLFFILSLPVVMTWLANKKTIVTASHRETIYQWACKGSLLAAVALLFHLLLLVKIEYIDAYKDRPHYSFFERTFVYEEMAGMPLEFIAQNNLHLRLFAHWNTSQLVMWKAPTAKLYFDARATQLYENEQLKKYRSILIYDQSTAAAALTLLNEVGTNALLLQARPDMAPLMRALDSRQQWVPVFFWDHWVIYMKRGSAPLQQLIQGELSGTNWWPAARPSQSEVGSVFDPVVQRRAVYYYRTAIRKMPVLGLHRYLPMTRAWLALGETDIATEYLDKEEQKLRNGFPRMHNKLRQALLGKIAAGRLLLQ